MKKLTAILLLTIYLFNLIGYSFLFQYLINDADTQLVQHLDNNSYNNKDLIEVRVPLNMPYVTATKNFERVNGQIELNGIHYNYVKRKISGDTLYVLCMPNVLKTSLYNAKANFAKENNDNPSGKKNSESPVKKLNIQSEYSYNTTQFNLNSRLLLNDLKDRFICPSITSVFIKAPVQPPDFNS